MYHRLTPADGEFVAPAYPSTSPDPGRPAATPAGVHIPATPAGVHIPATRWAVLYRSGRRAAWKVVATAETHEAALQLIGSGGRRHGDWLVREEQPGGAPCRT